MHVLRIAQLRVGRHRLVGGVACQRPHQQRLGIAVDRRRCVRFCKASPRQSVAPVDLGRTRVVLDGLAGGGGRELVPEAAASQVCVVGRRIVTLACSDRRHALGGQLQVNLICERDAHLA